MSKSPQRALVSWTQGQGAIATGSVTIDATVSEQHTLGAEVTRHQVESGIDVTDHIRPIPTKVTLEGVITNSPLGVPASYSGGVTGSVKAIQKTVKGRKISYQAFTFDSPMERVREVYGDLGDAIGGAALFGIVTTLANYSDYACTGFEVTRNVEKGRALFFTMQLEQLRIVSTQTVQALPPKAQKKHRGAKPGTEVDANTQDKKRTFALNVASQLFGIFQK